MPRIHGPLLSLLLLLGHSGSLSAQPAPAVPAEAPAWPTPGARLTAPPLSVPKGFRKKRIYLDAGHGFQGQHGQRVRHL